MFKPSPCVVISLYGFLLLCSGCAASVPANEKTKSTVSAQEILPASAVKNFNGLCSSAEACPEFNALLKAVASDDLLFVEKLLIQGMNPNEMAPGDLTPLFMAARVGDVEIIELLIKKGAKVDGPAIAGRTPLMESIHREQKGAFDALILAGADVNVQSHSGWTALMSAAHRGRVDFVAVLLSAGADVFATRHEDRTSALTWGVKKGNLEVVRLLLKAGAVPELPDVEGRTAFDYARDGGDVELEQLLLEFASSQAAPVKE